MNQSKNKNENTTKKITSKQIVAATGIVLLVLMYVITLIVAFMDTSASGALFGICLLATFAIPLLIWIYTWMYGKLTGKKTIADLNIGGDDHVTEEEVRELLIKQAQAGNEDENP